MISIIIQNCARIVLNLPVTSDFIPQDMNQINISEGNGILRAEIPLSICFKKNLMNVILSAAIYNADLTLNAFS